MIWVDLRRRGLEQLESTPAAVKKINVETFVVGQSPIFITDVSVVGASGKGVFALGP
ncbi:MAG: hypothetical protein QM744_01755 [Mesorhizobium sp.]